MKATMTLSASMGCSMFDLYDQDTDEVIMTINYYILLSEQEPTETTTAPTHKPVAKKQERIRVTDETATGGWF